MSKYIRALIMKIKVGTDRGKKEERRVIILRLARPPLERKDNM